MVIFAGALLSVIKCLKFSKFSSKFKVVSLEEHLSPLGLDLGLEALDRVVLDQVDLGLVDSDLVLDLGLVDQVDLGLADQVDLDLVDLDLVDLDPEDLDLALVDLDLEALGLAHSIDSAEDNLIQNWINVPKKCYEKQ